MWNLWFIRTVLGPVLWVGWFSVIDCSFPMHLTGMLPVVWFSESWIIGNVEFLGLVPWMHSYQIPWNVLGYAKRFCGAFSKLESQVWQLSNDVIWSTIPHFLMWGLWWERSSWSEAFTQDFIGVDKCFGVFFFHCFAWFALVDVILSFNFNVSIVHFQCTSVVPFSGLFF